MNKKPNKIIIMTAGWLGDSIMLSSLIQEIRRINANTKIEITVLNTHKSLQGLFNRVIGVDNVIEYFLPRKKLSACRRVYLSFKIRQQKFDEFICAPNTWKAALIGFLAGIKIRTGWHGESRLLLINNRHVGVDNYTTMVQRYVALAYKHDSYTKITFSDCCYPKLMATSQNISLLAKNLKIKDYSIEKKNITLCPGAAYGASKRWPAIHFAKLAILLIDHGYNVHIMGANAEIEIADTIQKHTSNSCINWCGKLRLESAIDVMSQSDCVVANDSGLMHMAAALDIAVIALYGATKPSFAPPLTDKAESLYIDIACRPCGSRVCPLKHYDCLFKVTPNQVFSKIQDLLK